MSVKKLTTSRLFSGTTGVTRSSLRQFSVQRCCFRLFSQQLTRASCERRYPIQQHLFFSGGGSKNAAKATAETATKQTSSRFSKFLKWYLGPKPMPERWTLPWYREMVLVCTVFAITGSSTMVLVRPAVSKGLGLQGSLKDGPWSYRICSIVVMTPIYATMLLVVGTLFGRHQYFRHFSVKMWSRFGIPPEMLDKSYHVTKKHFRKW